MFALEFTNRSAVSSPLATSMDIDKLKDYAVYYYDFIYWSRPKLSWEASFELTGIVHTAGISDEYFSIHKVDEL
jgi:hypothetical protein